MSIKIARLCMRLILLSFCMWASHHAIAATAPRIEWTNQLQTSVDAFSHDIAIGPAGEVYVTGYTDDTQLGPGHGGWNSFVSKYDSSGLLQWTKSLDLGYSEQSNSVVVDHAGDVYISGFVGGSSDGVYYDGRDAFLSKLSSAGNLLWTRQFGAPGPNDAANAMAVDRTGSIYLSGYTESGLGEPGLGENDAFLAKYNSEGTLLWKQLLGSDTRDDSYAIDTDSLGNVYVTSHTSISLGIGVLRRWDGYLSKFDSDGDLLWRQRQLDVGPFESDSVVPESIAIDELGSVFLSGHTTQGGSTTASFIRKLDTEGNVEWNHRFTGFTSSSLAADGLGNVYLSGTDFYGRGQILLAATVLKLDSVGEIVWSVKTDATGSDFSNTVATDGLGTIYIAGKSYDGPFAPNKHPVHAYVTKFSEVPEPASLTLLFVCSSVFLKRNRATPTV